MQSSRADSISRISSDLVEVKFRLSVSIHINIKAKPRQRFFTRILHSLKTREPSKRIRYFGRTSSNRSRISILFRAINLSESDSLIRWRLLPVEAETVVFDDPLGSLNGWSQSEYVDNGHITGEIGVDSGGSFYPRLVGQVVEPGVWQGPSMKKSIGEEVRSSNGGSRRAQKRSSGTR